MKWMKLLFLLVTLALSGCGGGDDNATSGSGVDTLPPVVVPPNPTGNLRAMSFSLRLPLTQAETTSLDLSPYVEASQKQHLTLSRVVALSPSCSVGAIDAQQLRVDIPTQQVGMCVYRYKVTDSDHHEASGLARLVTMPVTTSPYLGLLPVGNRLSDINQSVTLGDIVSMDLGSDPAIASDVSSMTHPLFSETTIISGSGTATLTEDGLFTFNAIAVGTTEVTYYVLDDKYTLDNQDDEIYVGRVMISVSGNTNTAPTADDGVYSTPLSYGSQIEIDVADFPDASDGTLIHDNDASLLHKEPLQLVFVQADDVFVELSAPDDVTNTKFKVKAPLSPRSEGYHETQVRYVVYDHNEDGVAHGTITFAIGKKLESLTITPYNSATSGTSSLSIAKGQRQGFVATGTYDDGTQELISNAVLWDSDTPTVASINTQGVARGLSVGTTNISASIETLDGRTLNSNEIELTVTEAELMRFWLTPANQELPLGVTGTITATGLYTDGTTAPISDEVTWSMTPTGIATIDTSVVGTAHPAADVHTDNMGTTSVSATTTDGLASQNQATIVVKEKAISSVQLTPAKINNLPKGRKKQMTAVVNYTDLSTLDVTLDSDTIWETDDTSIAAFSTPSAPGKVTGVELGTTTATVTYGGVVSNEAQITVTDPVVKNIQVTPANVSIPKGTDTFLDALATYTDGTQRHISSEATWSVGNTHVGTITEGTLYGAGEGTTTATAELDGKISNDVAIEVTEAIVDKVEITTTPDPLELPAGLSQPLAALATYSDGSTLDVTSTAAWSTADASVATITSPGGVVTAGVGASGQSTTATVEWDTQHDSIELNVTDAIITNIDVTPPNQTIPIATTLDYTAMATYSDGNTIDITSSTDTAWSTSEPSIATIGATGVLSADAIGGPIKVRANNGGITGETEVTVVDALLESIDVTPATMTLEIGDIRNLTATGNYSNGSTETITDIVNWTDQNTSIATVDSGTTNGGKVTAIAPGTTSTVARLDTISSNPAQITVKAPPTPVGITASPVRQTIGSDGSCDMIVYLKYSDGSTQSINQRDVNVSIEENFEFDTDYWGWLPVSFDVVRRIDTSNTSNIVWQATRSSHPGGHELESWYSAEVEFEYDGFRTSGTWDVDDPEDGKKCF
ncbi:Ig-like domain-containing protein [Vibrio parahaemolyticus]|nr:Ig-like domain-containing protein [Vibrio parahaemolyticus]